MSAAIHIPFYDHGAEYRLIRQEIDTAVERVLLSGEYEQGDEVASFERNFCSAGGCGLRVPSDQRSQVGIPLSAALQKVVVTNALDRYFPEDLAVLIKSGRDEE